MHVNGNVLYTSYSQKLPQYVSCGVPVIAWDTLDTQFLKQERIGDIAAVEDINSLAQAIKRLLTMSDSEYTQLRLRARAYAEANFSAKVLAAQRIAFWRSALATQTRSEK